MSSRHRDDRRRERSRSPIRTREDIVRERREQREREKERDEKRIRHEKRGSREDESGFPKISFSEPAKKKKDESLSSQPLFPDAPAHMKTDGSTEFKKYEEPKAENGHKREFKKPKQELDEDGNPKKKEPKQKASLALSGALTEDTNTYKGVVIKYSEPDNAKTPKKRWRLYPFKGKEALKVLHIHRQSAFLIGKHRGIVDIPVDHPSCSRQHAVIQYRQAGYTRADGSTGQTVKPYVIDLESGNGTFLNGKKLDPKRYYELKEKDVVKFGFSSRDYVVLQDTSSTDGQGLDDIGDDGKTDGELLDEFLDSAARNAVLKR